MMTNSTTEKFLKSAQGDKFRFLLAGGINTLFAYALFALGLWILTPAFSFLAMSECSYLLIQWFMWALSVPFSVLTLKYFAFRAKGSYLRQTIRSYAIYLPLQLFASLSLASFSFVLGLHPLIGQLITVFIVALISYLGHKYFTFRQTDTEQLG
jgi:putative flippase GtrA